MNFDPVTFLEAAVQHPSHERVGPMREFLVETLAEHGVEATVDDAGNTIATRGTGAPHVVLNTHIDTVPPHVPFERDGDVIRGRGSCDAKGPLAALLAAFFRVDLKRGRVTLAITPDEERYGTGAAALDIDADAFIVGEPTGLDVCTAAKGRFEGTITVHGENAHAAEPASGVNAISGAGAVIDALDSFDELADTPSAHPSLGPATLTPTVIRGGGTTNQVPARCDITVDRRSVPPETAEGFESALLEYLAEAVDASVSFAFTDRPTPFLEPFETPADHSLAETLANAAGGVVRPFTAATEASYFAKRAPTVVFGPGSLVDDDGPVAHADREYVPVAEVGAAADAVAATLASYVP